MFSVSHCKRLQLISIRLFSAGPPTESEEESVYPGRAQQQLSHSESSSCTWGEKTGEKEQMAEMI